MSAELLALQRRANEADRIIKQLNKTITQLQSGGNSQMAQSKMPVTGVTRETLQTIRKNLLKTRENVEALESKLSEQDEIITKQAKIIHAMKTTVRDELLSIRNEMLTNGAALSPKDFRSAVEQYLRDIRAEVVELEKKAQQSSSNAPVASGVPTEKLQKIRESVVSIRSQLLEKEKQFDDYRNGIRSKLTALKTELSAVNAERESFEKEKRKLENQIRGLQRENEEYRKGDRIPLELQTELRNRLQVVREECFRIETENIQLRMSQETADPLRELPHKICVSTVDMHTGGEPLRIIESGVPELQGSTILEKRAHMHQHMDEYRRFLMYEPRGHFDMYGAILTTADDPSAADFGVLFLHNEGYSSMCGHAVLALGRYAVDFGKVKLESDTFSGDAQVRIQTPSGVVVVTTEVKDGKSTGKVRFVSSPCWVEHSSQVIMLDQWGKVELDVGYGGTYYAILPAARFQLSVRDSSVQDLIHIATMVTNTVKRKLDLNHPDSKDLEFIYGTILTDGHHDVPSANICVFADRQVDRCPTGSGVMARLAVDCAKGLTKVGDTREFIGRSGSVFTGKVIATQKYGGRDAVIVEVGGSAHYCGRATHYLEASDDLGRGFLIQ